MTPSLAPNPIRNSSGGDHIVGNLSLDLDSQSRSSNESPNDQVVKSIPTSDISTRREAKANQDEDDYDLLEVDPANVLRGSKGGGLRAEPTLDVPQEINPGTRYQSIIGQNSPSKPGRQRRRQSFSIKLEKTNEKGRYILKADDPELRHILHDGLQKGSEADGATRRSRFRDLVFTRQFTAFDRQNSESSPFRGFYTLFWLGTFLMLVKIAAENWKIYGSIFGRNEILAMMFHRDVLLLGLTDGVICFSTVFCLLLQRSILAGYISWNSSGWVIQNVRHYSFTRIFPS